MKGLSDSANGELPGAGEKIRIKPLRMLGLLVLLIEIALSIVGYAVLEKSPGTEQTPIVEVVVTRMMALYVGPLTMVDGCLRLGCCETDELVVWPPDFEATIENDTIRVRYDDQDVEVRLGQVVRLGGGEVKSIEAFDKDTRQQVPSGCSGPYWLASSISPVEAPDLAGTEWALTSLNGEGLIESTEITLYFEETFLGGSMTCNGYGGGPDSGKYVARDDGTLDILRPLAVTAQLCSSPEGIMEQEEAYIEALLSAATYRVIVNRLEIDDADGETILVFAAKTAR
jgi:heat shock protein HslJ